MRLRSTPALAIATCVLCLASGCAADAPAAMSVTPSAPHAPTALPITAALSEDDLALCLTRTVDPPAGFFLTASSSAADHLRAAVTDVRGALLTADPDGIARLVLDASVPRLTVVPAVGGSVTDDDLAAAFATLSEIDVDLPAALAAVEVAAPEGRPFSAQCEAYGDAWALMQANPDEGPTLVHLGFDIALGVVQIGVTDPADPWFAALAAHREVVEIVREECCDVGA